MYFTKTPNLCQSSVTFINNETNLTGTLGLFLDVDIFDQTPLVLNLFSDF